MQMSSEKVCLVDSIALTKEGRVETIPSRHNCVGLRSDEGRIIHGIKSLKNYWAAGWTILKLQSAMLS